MLCMPVIDALSKEFILGKFTVRGKDYQSLHNLLSKNSLKLLALSSVIVPFPFDRETLISSP